MATFMKNLLLIFLPLLSSHLIYAQEKNYKVCIVAFYNLENLYDTMNNPLVNDEDFTPLGNKHYTGDIYTDKLNKLATVISLIGKDISPGGPALLGVAEIENDTVLNDLVHHPLLKHRKYQQIHFNSKDIRGIDVALLYHPKLFLPENAETLFVQLPGNSKEAYFTRDILYVKGMLAGETVHIYVNHWPSRRGGEERSSPAREAAATVCKKHVTAVLKKDPHAKIIIMGDLNDDPDSPSITEVLKAKSKITDTHSGELFNPWAELYASGIGTLANRDSWGLFDQIILSHAWLNRQQEGLFYQQQGIFNRSFMRENSGRYKGYPMRTWDGNTYRGGYSDHFPTYIVLLKKLK
ncbi:MAG: endonuclease/exonuclease/phosphatase [Sediminibacterium sp.]|nr:endonuclease/exonuclease/phosphatase [Sediminibacterium sp.]MDP3127489.1 endonuclease/exonuclease/phosphatase [Sediminibacterium sp.]